MTKSLPTAIWRGLCGRCPRCAQTSIFASFLGIQPACSSCGLDLSREDSGDAGSVFLTFGIGLIAAIVMLVIVFGLGAPLRLGLGVMVVLVLGLTLVSLRPTKGLFIALAWHHNSGDTSAKR